MEKPKLKYENGKLVVEAAVGVDTDHDGKQAVSLKVNLEIDAMEAVGEIVKDKVPDWLKEIIGSKGV